MGDGRTRSRLMVLGLALAGAASGDLLSLNFS